MRNVPLSSVTVERTFSISAGLAASTVTPGSTAPEESVTTPVTDERIDCADAAAGTSATHIMRVKNPARRGPPATTCSIVRLPDDFAMTTNQLIN